MKKHAIVAIATFADDEEEALVSGRDLVRRYLNVAFGEAKSNELIPGAFAVRIYSLFHWTMRLCHDGPSSNTVFVS